MEQPGMKNGETNPGHVFLWRKVWNFFPSFSLALTAPVVCMYLHCWECRLSLPSNLHSWLLKTEYCATITAHLLCNKHKLMAKYRSHVCMYDSCKKRSPHCSPINAKEYCSVSHDFTSLHIHYYLELVAWYIAENYHMHNAATLRTHLILQHFN